MIKVRNIEVKNLINLFIISLFMCLLLLINNSVQKNVKSKIHGHTRQNLH